MNITRVVEKNTATGAAKPCTEMTHVKNSMPMSVQPQKYQLEASFWGVHAT